ncbi:MAG: hypothetical protein IAG10_02940 [Planctomycetaceae bacterium]|nr:hypothetical protein [Planctomycetaceae bacterium]
MMKQFTRNNAADNLPWPVTMRFGNVLLSCVLLALSAGHSLPPHIAGLCYLFGLSGLAFYFCLELVANRRSQQRSQAASAVAAERLTRRLRAEKAVAVPDRDTTSAEHTTGDIESAMDSKADFDVYVGLQTQPTLSV